MQVRYFYYVLLICRNLLTRKALRAYATPQTAVTAAFACLLDRSRSPVLEALIELDRNDVMSTEVLGPSLAVLGAKSHLNVGDLAIDDLPDKLSLPLAALYLGNLDAFILLSEGFPPDDGALHTAAFLALPRFVKKLLDTHDPNLKEEEFGQRIPLALACEAKELPWCKIANAEADFRTRQRETMALLAPVSSPHWRHRGKTVLHIALENGPGATRALIQADGNRRTKYTYTDRAGKQYDPREYVMHFIDGTDEEKADLIDCLVEGRVVKSSS